MQFTPLQLLELGLLGIAYLVNIAGVTQQTGYLRAHPQVATADDFERFRAFARAQMHFTIALMVCVLPAILLIFIGDAPASNAERLVLWLPYGGMFFFGYFGKKLEARIKDPARCAEPLRPEFARICHSWKHKLLPDF